MLDFSHQCADKCFCGILWMLDLLLYLKLIFFYLPSCAKRIPGMFSMTQHYQKNTHIVLQTAMTYKPLHKVFWRWYIETSMSQTSSAILCFSFESLEKIKTRISAWFWLLWADVAVVGWGSMCGSVHRAWSSNCHMGSSVVRTEAFKSLQWNLQALNWFILILWACGPPSHLIVRFTLKIKEL